MSECQCPDCARVRHNMDHLRKRLRGLELAPARAEERHASPLYCLETEAPLVDAH